MAVAELDQWTRSRTAPYRIAFVLEQSLGHVTHARNLTATVTEDPEVQPALLPIAYDSRGRLPLLDRNWSVRASERARLAVRRAGGPAAFDALFFHTQVTALFSVSAMRRVPSIISLDATPHNYDTVGRGYGHDRGVPLLERGKDLLNRRAYHAAAHLVTWSAWARRSLIEDYGIAGDKVTVIPPGTQLELWQHDGSRKPDTGKVRLLFVGGDFQRKGGDLLLDVFQHHLAGTCELDIVTGADVRAPGPGVRIHHNVQANSEPLRRLFAQAEIFVLPTRADCLAVALMEATAAGLPIVSTHVGALDEAVLDGQNGLLVPPDDGAALAAALQRLVANPLLRQAMGRKGRSLAEEVFDAKANGRRLLALLKAHADR